MPTYKEVLKQCKEECLTLLENPHIYYSISSVVDMVSLSDIPTDTHELLGVIADYEKTLGGIGKLELFIVEKVDYDYIFQDLLMHILKKDLKTELLNYFKDIYCP